MKQTKLITNILLVQNIAEVTLPHFIIATLPKKIVKMPSGYYHHHYQAKFDLIFLYSTTSAHKNDGLSRILLV